MTKEIKEQYINIKCGNDAKSKKFYNSYYFDVIKIDDYFMPIEKSQIIKNFEEWANINVTDEEKKYEYDLFRRFANDENYFINENLKIINNKITILKNFLFDFEKENQRLENEYATKYIDKFYFCKKSEYECFYILLSEKNINNYIIIRQATKNDIKTILSILEEEKRNFTKRLNIYLRKYGLSKVNDWLYLLKY